MKKIEVYKKIKRLWRIYCSDYRHFICLLISTLFLFMALFKFKYAGARIFESLIDLKNSALHYVSELFELYKWNVDIITVNNFTKMPFEMPFNLPSTWEEFVTVWNTYWNIFFTKENITAYVQSLSDVIYYFSKFVLLFMPLIVLAVILLNGSGEVNNNYNVDSKALKKYKKFEEKYLDKIKLWLKSFKEFLVIHKFYIKLWICLAIYSFNVIAILCEALSYYLYFVVSFDLVNLYVQVLKLLFDSSILLDFIPLLGWIIIVYVIFNAWRKNVGYDKLNHMESCNCGMINERPITIMVCGTMGKKKTTMITDIALSEEVILRDVAFKKLLEFDLKFPNFPWINLERFIKRQMKNHVIYSLATARQVIWELQFYQYFESDDKALERVVKRRWRRNVSKRLGYKYSNSLFDYDFARYGTSYYDGLICVDLWDVISTYTQLYFIYVIESSLLISNYSIRVDNVLQDVGNFPLWNSDFFGRDERLSEAYTRHAHILDFDSLRLGKQVIEFNEKGNSFEFGVINITEIGKERGNNLELQAVKKNDDSANQKNDLFNAWLKMVRHSATVDNYPFVKVITDEQRPESWGADARDLCEIVTIDDCSEVRLAMPLFFVEDSFIDFLYSRFVKLYNKYRFERGDNTLKMYLFKGLISKLYKYQKRIYNTFGYYEMGLGIESGRQDGNVKSSKYYLMFKKIYSKRFSTDCFSGFFNEKSLRSKLGINDLQEFASEKASFEEMLLENSYFFNDLVKIKDKNKE